MRRRSEEEETTATRGIMIMFGPSSRINPLIIIIIVLRNILVCSDYVSCS